MQHESIIISDLCPHHDDNEHRDVSRYQRSDVKAVIVTRNFFWLTRKIPVQLLDYGSKGVCLGRHIPLPYFRFILLQLTFPGHPSFELEGEIVYRQEPEPDHPLHRYGVTFIKNHALYKDFILQDGMQHKLNNSSNQTSN